MSKHVMQDRGPTTLCCTHTSVAYSADGADGH